MASIPEAKALADPGFPGYTIREVVAAGLAGQVHAASHVGSGLEVAIEVITPPLTLDAEFRDRLWVEVDRATALEHPSIVAVYEAVSAGQRLGLVTEPFGGATLAATLGNGGLPLAATLLVAEGVLLALVVAHRGGVIHGGVDRPAVILSGGRIRLAGFGIAPALHPELPALALTDTFAVARLAAGLLVGGRSSGGAASLPRHVRAVLTRGTATSPERRYRTASGMRAALVAAARHDIGPDWREVAAGEVAALVGSPPIEDDVEALPPKVASRPSEPAVEPSPPLPTPPEPPRAVEPLAPIIRAVPSGAPLGRVPQRRPLKPAAVGLGLVAAAVAVGLLVGFIVSQVHGPAVAGALSVAKPVSVRVEPSQGSCNTVFVATATAQVRGQGTIVYRWERSDGLQTADARLPVAATDGSFLVIERWQLTGQVQHPAITFHLLAPLSESVTSPIRYSCP